MVWGIAAAAGIGALGSIFSANEQSDAASDAARAQTQAANNQIDLYRDIYEDQRNLQQPYYQAGLQAMYGSNGLMNLLGYTQPSGSAPQQSGAQPQGGQPQNAFSQYASGSYGATSPQAAAQQESDQFMGYVQGNDDLLSAFNNLTPKDIRDIASTQYDADGDGRISMSEYGNFQYDRYGASEGRQLPSAQPQNAFASTPAPNIVADGNGGYRQGGEGSQLAQIAPATTDTGGTQPIGSMTETLRQTPGYQFLQDESARAVENSFASRGELLSGAAVDALNTRTLGLADNTYQQSVNNQFNLANLGMGSAAQITSAGNNFANATGSAYGSIGNAQAANAYGQANAFSNGLQGVSDSVMGGLGAYGAYSGWGQGGGDNSFVFNQNGGNQLGWIN